MTEDKATWFDYVPTIIAMPIVILILVFVHLFVPRPWHKHFNVD